MMMAVTLWFMKSMKQIKHLHWQKGSTKNGANGRNPEDCNFSWLAGSVPRWSPINEFAEIEAENYHLHNGMLLFRKNVNRSLAERNKSLPAQSKNQSGKDPIKNDVRIVDRSYLQKSFKLSQKQLKKLIEGVVEKFELTSDQERAFRIIANHAVTPGS